MFPRRSVVAALAVLALATPNASVAQEKIVRMGYQKVGALRF